MQKSLLRKTFVIVMIVFFIGVSVIPSTGRIIKNRYISSQNNNFFEDQETEFWALIFAVGIYKNNPWENRPPMLVCANDLYELLLASPNWQASHIHKVTASDATGKRLIKELLWLIKNEDSNDISLIYITTHGGPLIDSKGKPVDLPPKDEEDGADEILAMFESFDKRFAYIWDDLLNFFLSLLQSKGVCLIVDTCHAGGFNDDPMFPRSTNEYYTAESFSKGLAEELSGSNRVVLMSCAEDQLSYGSDFSELLIDGFWGWADFKGNRDGINSAEEAFKYTKLHLNNPTILDLYPGELPITYS